MANKYKYIGPNGKQKIGGKFSGWGYSDSITHMDCPSCGSKKGFYCETAKGRRKFVPHPKRVIALMESGYTANHVAINGRRNKTNGIKIMTGDNFIKELQEKLES